MPNTLTQPDEDQDSQSAELNPAAQRERELLEQSFAAPAIKDEDRNTSRENQGSDSGSQLDDRADTSKKSDASGEKGASADASWKVAADIGSAVSAARAASGGPAGAMKAISKTLWSTRRRRQTTVGGGIGGGIVITFIVLMILFLPALKLESVVNNLEKRAGAASSAAMDQEANNLFKNYLAKYVMPNLGKGRCRSTIDENCVSVVAGDGPVKQLYKAWRQDKLTEKLASKYDLTFGKSGTTVYINTNGQKFNFKDEASLESALTDEGTTVGSRGKVASALSEHLRQFSLSDRIYFRFVLAPFVNARYGTVHCVDACNALKTKFTDPPATRVYAAKGKIYSRVIAPLSEDYSFMLQCALLGGAGCNVRDLRSASPGDTNLQTEADAEIQGRLRTLAQGYTDEELTDLVEKSGELGKDSMSKVIVRAVVEKLVETGGGDAAKAGTAAADAVDPVTWALIAAQLADTARNLGPTLQYLGYAANSAAAAQLFTTYQSVSAETRSGNVDALELGSFNNALGTSVDTSNTSSITAARTQLKGTDTTPCSMTQSPYYQQTFGSASESAGIGTAKGNNTGCKCDDGKPVPTGKAICSEESLARGTDVTSFVAQLSGFYNAYLNAVPGLNGVLGVLNKINGVAGWAVEKILPLLTGPVKAYCNTPIIGEPCQAGLSAAQAAAQPLLDLTMKLIVNSPFLHLTGGRLLDMLAAGSYVVFGTSGQQTLGAPYVDNATAGKLQTAYLDQQKQDFRQQPLFARMFSTQSPYSLVSRLAIAAPASTSAAGTQLATSLSRNPLNIVGNSFATLLRPLQANADDSTATGANPFDVPNSAYTKAQVPDDPDTFWDNNCVNGPLGKWDASQPAGHQLDISDWLNAGHNSQSDKLLEQAEFGIGINQPSTAKVIEIARGMGMNVIQDPDTGQAIYVNANPCLLILSTVQADGGKSDPTLLPQDSLTSDDNTSGGGGNLKIATFNVLGAGHPGAPYTTRADKSIGIIQSHDLDVVGFQEYTPKQQNYFMRQDKLGATYDSFPKPGSDRGENSIIWKTGADGFTLEDSGWQPDVVYFCNHNLDAPWVKLKSAATGQEFYVLNTHDPAYAPASNNCSNEAAAGRLHDANAHVALLKQLKSDGLPMFFTGDFNSGYELKPSGNGTAVGNNPQNLTYCIMTQSGVVSDAYDVYRSRKAKCPNPITGSDAQNLGGGIDHIYVSDGVQVTGWTKIPGANGGVGSASGSDHTAMLWDFTIPGSGNSTKTPSSGEIQIGGVNNFRDAATSSGDVLKSGILYRSGDLNQLTDKGSQTLSQLLGSGSTIIDLRTAVQRKAAPDAKVAGSKTVNTPIDGILSQGPMVTDPDRRKGLANALRAAENANGTVLVHCTDGKDRTGWLVAMVMYNAGASDKQVMDEYMASSAAYPNGVKEAWLNDGLDAIKKNYGTVKNYLKKGVGLSDADLQKLNQKFKYTPGDGTVVD